MLDWHPLQLDILIKSTSLNYFTHQLTPDKALARHGERTNRITSQLHLVRRSEFAYFHQLLVAKVLKLILASVTFAPQ